MSEVLDRISPTFIGSDAITIEVDQVSQPLLAERAIILNFNYDDTLPNGVRLPLILQIQPAFGDGTGYFRKIFSRSVPSSFAHTYPSAGQYLILLREFGHNNWQGRLLIEVGGGPLRRHPLFHRPRRTPHR